ncbi:MAG: Beta-galactosidase C-terminal domain [Bacteroidota bacterium]
MPRQGESNGTVVINLTNNDKHITLNNQSGKDIISGEKLENAALRLEPFDVKVIRWEK